ATFALNAGLWFRRGRLAMVFSSLAASCCCCAENPLIPAVQISGTTSSHRGSNRLTTDPACVDIKARPSRVISQPQLTTPEKAADAGCALSLRDRSNFWSLACLELP
ncbi:MAG: hypothetical protein Q8K20_03430, partial [Gemmobacter sp.]|nr:hypothetical protein [Gemmobacter sp.]